MIVISPDPNPFRGTHCLQHYKTLGQEEEGDSLPKIYKFFSALCKGARKKKLEFLADASAKALTSPPPSC